MADKKSTRVLAAEFAGKHARAEQASRAIKVDLVRGITSFKQAIPLTNLATMAAVKKFDRLIDMVPWDKLQDKLSKVIDRLADTADRAMATEAKSIAKALAIPERQRFDISNPAIANFINTRTGNLITTTREGTVQAVRTATALAFNKGASPKDVAVQIRDSIGLNARQAQALANYRFGLSAPEKGLSPEKVNALADGYAERLLDQRATMIARTEVRNAVNAGQQEVWEDAHVNGYLPKESRRIWAVDGNPCPEICRPMDGVETGLYDPWRLPDGRLVDNPSLAHPGCFCVMSLGGF